MADSPVAAYIVEQSNGQFKLTRRDPYGPAPYGIAIPKGNGMTQPVLDAVKALMADGTYDEDPRLLGPVGRRDRTTPTINRDRRLAASANDVPVATAPGRPKQIAATGAA